MHSCDKHDPVVILYIHIQAYIHTYIHTYIPASTSMGLCLREGMHTHAKNQMHWDLRAEYACMHVCMYVCMYVCKAGIYMRRVKGTGIPVLSMHVCMYVCMYVCM